MRLFLAALLLAGCSQKTSFQPFTEASGAFTAELPSNWQRDGHEDLRKTPAAVMTWIAELVDQSEGYQVGTMIHINRFQRKGATPAFKKSTLAPTDALFGSGKLPADVSVMTVSGHPARRLQREFEQNLGGGMHAKKGPFAMRLEDVVIQTPDAYYALEYRSTKDLFDKHHGAFERLLATIRIP